MNTNEAILDRREEWDGRTLLISPHASQGNIRSYPHMAAALAAGEHYTGPPRKRAPRPRPGDPKRPKGKPKGAIGKAKRDARDAAILRECQEMLSRQEASSSGMPANEGQDVQVQTQRPPYYTVLVAGDPYGSPCEVWFLNNGDGSADWR